ncbi:alpha/beta fold hydrolase [Brachybacterium sp. AOP43-C2-M15]|uniref:alpha/beta fold hydrolase n=1 Tax=Brachybacterium sp. AOP43-C2-M15 TaxID=3457661 RepID=UPI00403466ED
MTGALLAEPWPVVLVHGTRTSHSQWDLQLPALRAAGHAVRTPDLPGHGRRRGEPFALEAAIAAIEEQVRGAADATGLPVHLVGSSLGGMLAIHAAAQLVGRAAVQRGDGAAVRQGGEATASHGGVQGPAGGALGSLTACGAALQPTPLLARLYARLVVSADLVPGMASGGAPLFTALLGVDGARAYHRGGRADIEVVAPAFAALASLDLAADLRGLPVPVTFLHGRRDQMRWDERVFARAAPRGRLELLPYGTHMVNLNASHRFNADLLRILARAQREVEQGTVEVAEGS